MNYQQLWSQLKQDLVAMKKGQMMSNGNLLKHMQRLEMPQEGYEEQKKGGESNGNGN